MPIRYLKKHAALEGHVSVEEAENLHNWLKVQARPAVNVERCDHVHAAVLQVLLAFRPAVQGVPTSTWLAQALARSSEAPA